MSELTDILWPITNRYITEEIFRRNFSKSPWLPPTREQERELDKQRWLNLACHCSQIHGAINWELAKYPLGFCNEIYRRVHGHYP